MMPLFEIPGWSISSEPVVEHRGHGSKKRKTPTGDADSRDANLEKLVKRLKGSSKTSEYKDRNWQRAEETGLSVSHNGNGRRRGKKSKVDVVEEERKNTISLPKPLKATHMDSDMIMVSPRKKISKERQSATDSSSPINISPTMNAGGSTAARLTSLQEGMKQSLDGARFRQGIPFDTIPVLSLDNIQVDQRNSVQNR
jgi:ribosomal RNA-processing protein 8